MLTTSVYSLIGDPNYGIILEAYPFVARKLLKEDRPAIQRALQQVLYAKGGLQSTRLSVLLNSALGVVAKTSSAVVDFDTLPEDSVDLGTAVKFLLSEQSNSLRKLLVDESILAFDVLLRQVCRKAFTAVTSSALFRPPLLSQFLPKLDSVPIPIIVPPDRSDDSAKLIYTSPRALLDILTPALSREEELYALSLVDAITQTLGSDAAAVIAGDAVLEPNVAIRLLLDIISSSEVEGLSNVASQLHRVVGNREVKGRKGDNGVADLTRVLSKLNTQQRNEIVGDLSLILSALRDKLLTRLRSQSSKQ